MDVSPSRAGVVKLNDSTPSSYPMISTFASGSSVNLEAVAATGYRFKNWSGDVAGNGNPTTITIDCNKRVTAQFSHIEHTLTIQTNGSGSTIPMVGNHTYGEGTKVTIRATPDDGWQFDGWTGDVNEPDIATVVVIMESNNRVIANFSQAKLSWSLIGSFVAGILVIGVTIFLAVRGRATSRA